MMETPRVLIVDDQASVRESVRMVLKESCKVSAASDGATALQELAGGTYHVVLLDILMPGMDGLEVLERAQSLAEPPQFIMLTATKTVKTAVRAMKLGAFDYVNKPFDIDELQLTVKRAAEVGAMRREIDTLRDEVGKRYEIENVIGSSPPMQAVLKMVSRVAPLRSTVLLTGESGTGKEVIARAIHFNSPRRDQPMVAINCAAIPDNLLEAELFGHERGAFTDAHSRKVGHFERAHKGTIFLDEIGDMDPSSQATLLRILETGQFTRVGGEESVDVDVRVIAATNRDLDRGIKDGTFRDDLYFRLNVVPIALPPLRDRREDLPLLIRHFLDTLSRKAQVKMRHFSAGALDRLLAYHWPGNVRELQNLIERALVLCENDEIGISDLPPAIANGSQPVSATATLPESAADDSSKSLDDAVAELEHRMIVGALEVAKQNQTRAAQILGTTRRVLKYKMDKLSIADQRFEDRHADDNGASAG